MAVYHQIYNTFWTDIKIVDSFTVEDRYFYLYLLTNSQVNLCGCYEIGNRQIVFETGLTLEQVTNLLQKMETVHDVIRYSPKNKEILLLNWHKYNWSTSVKFLKGVLKESEKIKTSEFKEYVQALATGEKKTFEKTYGMDRVSGDENTVSNSEKYPTENAVIVSVIDSVNVNDNVNVNNNKTLLSNSNELSNKVCPSLQDERGESEPSAVESDIKPSEKIKQDFSKEVQVVVDAWNALEDVGINPVSKVTSGSKRREYLIARIRQYGVDDVIRAIGQIRKSKFLIGENNRGWRVDFDWFVKPSNFPKVLDGNYTDRERKEDDIFARLK